MDAVQIVKITADPDVLDAFAGLHRHHHLTSEAILECEACHRLVTAVARAVTREVTPAVATVSRTARVSDYGWKSGVWHSTAIYAGTVYEWQSWVRDEKGEAIAGLYRSTDGKQQLTVYDD